MKELSFYWLVPVSGGAVDTLKSAREGALLRSYLMSRPFYIGQ